MNTFSLNRSTSFLRVWLIPGTKIHIGRAGTILFVMTLIPLALKGQAGRVGINTLNPLAALHVADSSVVFTENTIPPNTAVGALLHVQGSGARMLWYPAWRAFRAGSVDGDQWNMSPVVNMGAFSFGAGFNVVAKGLASVALGESTIATGFHAAAFNENTVASENNSAAFGMNTTASGINSLVAGNGSVSSSLNSVALGSNTHAAGFHSLTTGLNTKTDLLTTSASAFGESTIAKASNSVTFGFHTLARSFSSLVLGRFNDTTSTSTSTWVDQDPLFIIGNGTSNAIRKNAVTILKNGNMGLATSNPTFRLHVVNDNPADGGFQEGIMVENTNVNPGEAALSFRNKSIPATRQWMIGINEAPPNLSFAYGPSFTVANTKMAMDTLGRLGINTTLPQASIHVVRNNPSGGSFQSSALAIFESNLTSYIQLSSENSDETGFLSGNQETTIRSAITFPADSSIDIRTGGNNTHLKIAKNGNIGIGTYTPAAKLHVNGPSILGANGTVVTQVIRATVNANVPSVPANGGTIAQTFMISNAAAPSAVSVSQDGVLAAGLVIASARVSAANTVEVRFVNTTAAAINPPAMDFHFVIIR